MRGIFTERRYHLTQISDIQSIHPQAAACPLRIVAFAANPRFVGAASLASGRPVELSCRRARGQRSRANDWDRLAAWAREFLSAHEPAVVAIAADDGRGGTAALPDAVAAVLDSLAVAAVPVPRDEVRRSLDLGASTCAAIRRAMAGRHRCVSARLKPARGRRSETERYWEAAVLAAAVGVAAHRRFSADPDRPWPAIPSPSTRGKGQ